MVIFGWGGSKFTDHGAAWRQTCPNCHNSGWFHYATTHSSFRLYFIPLIPYGRKHFLMCPICNKGPQLTEPGVATVKQAMRLLARARTGELTESQYNAELAMLLSPATAVLPAGAAGIDGPREVGPADATAASATTTDATAMDATAADAAPAAMDAAPAEPAQ